MDKKIKAKWIKALRSGRYKQGEDYLHNGRTYCCLGVLCAVRGAQWKNGDPYIDGKMVKSDNGNEELVMPSFAGIAKKTQTKLANMNDGRIESGEPLSFAEIADYIEKYL